MEGWGGGRSGRVVLIDNGRVYQSKAADALVQVKTTTFGTNVGLNMLLNISSRYFGGLFWSRQLRGLPSSDGYFYPSAQIGLEGYCRRLPGGRALPHTVTALPGAVLIGSWSNLVGTILGAGSRTSSFMGDVAH